MRFEHSVVESQSSGKNSARQRCANGMIGSMKLYASPNPSIAFER